MARFVPNKEQRDQMGLEDFLRPLSIAWSAIRQVLEAQGTLSKKAEAKIPEGQGGEGPTEMSDEDNSLWQEELSKLGAPAKQRRFSREPEGTGQGFGSGFGTKRPGRIYEKDLAMLNGVVSFWAVNPVKSLRTGREKLTPYGIDAVDVEARAVLSGEAWFRCICPGRDVKKALESVKAFLEWTGPEAAPPEKDR